MAAFAVNKERVLAYPDDFDTSAFIAGKRIALSRTGAIWVMVTLFLIIATCIALPWVQRNMRIDPFIVYVDGARGEWHLVGHDAPASDITYYKSMQRALVGVFTEKWFTIFGDENQNDKNWSICNRKSVCNQTTANTFWNDAGCDLYCISGEDMYQNFKENVMPLYQSRMELGDRWYVNTTQMTIKPNGTITKQGGSWIVNARVRSSLNGDFDIVAYVKVAYDITRYPQTLGYYVTKFNSYRLQ